MKKIFAILLIIFGVTHYTSAQRTFEPVVTSLGDAVKSLESKGFKVEKVTMGELPGNYVEYFTLKSGIAYGILTVCSPKVKDFNSLLYRNARGGKWSKELEESFSANTSTIKYRPYKSGKYRYDLRVNNKAPGYNKEYFYIILFSSI